jgi:MraZ protein
VKNGVIVVTGFYGNYLVKMDDKGRLALPAKLRPANPVGDELPASYILTMGLDRCLTLYPADEWRLVQQKLDTLEFTQANFRNFSRQLYSAAVMVRPDKQGRLIIPNHLISYAELKSEVLVLGSNRWVEFWDPGKYKRYLSGFGQSYEEVAESLFPKNRPPE